MTILRPVPPPAQPRDRRTRPPMQDEGTRECALSCTPIYVTLYLDLPRVQTFLHPGIAVYGSFADRTENRR
ncbi:hypothetical protein D9758_014996 [Tetrapyrgos nigripes]|uniref:Uncharacterized protein n=1 Tax=Tetrapyrgos nigripes TaxID=182062 RepID=A0A8H5FKP5_9AGAR|nr:hypothetical protein D9758_014996 [Tetrapyrgos nigripes]